MTVDLRWQFDLAWALADGDGVWRPDWSEVEPDPIPVPTIAWLTWHIVCWWSTAVDDLTGVAPRERAEVVWPGEGAAAVARLRGLAERWKEVLDTVDPAAPSAYPWDADAGLTATRQG